MNKKDQLEEACTSVQISCYRNPDWKARWIPFIMHDWDWDFGFLETLIGRKLILIREHYVNDDIQLTNRSIKSKIRKLDEVISLYNDLFNCVGSSEEEQKIRKKFYNKLGTYSRYWWD